MLGKVMGVAGLQLCGIAQLQLLSWDGMAWHRRGWDGIHGMRWWAYFLDAALFHTPR